MTRSIIKEPTTQREADIARLIRLEVLMEENRRQGAETKQLLAEQSAMLNTKLDALEKRFVERAEFAPIKSVVYGMVALILASVMTAIIYLVLK